MESAIPRPFGAAFLALCRGWLPTDSDEQAKLLVAPQPGSLAWVRGKVPTPLGPVMVNITSAATFRLEVELPAGSCATAVLLNRKEGQILLDGKSIIAITVGVASMVDVPSGRHILESR